MKEAVVYVGVDVAKTHLDVAWAEQTRRFPNKQEGIRALLEWLGANPALHLICEASGGYERALVGALQKENRLVSLVQASRVRKYAQATGVLAKTDQIDARVLSAFGHSIQPQPSRPISSRSEELREAEAQRRHLSQLLAL